MAPLFGSEDAVELTNELPHHDRGTNGNSHYRHTKYEPSVSRLLPARCIDFAIVETPKSFPFGCGIEYSIFDKLLQSKLQLVLHDTVNTLAVSSLIDANAFEVPKLIPKLRLALIAIIDALQRRNLAALQTKSSSS